MPREAKQDYWISESIKEQKFEDYYTQLTELGRYVEPQQVRGSP